MKRDNRGFTLVELLAVIVVLGIIALIGYGVVGEVIKSSKESTEKLSIKEYAKAVELARSTYLVEFGVDAVEDGQEFSKDWLEKNVKVEKSRIVCDKVIAGKNVELSGCQVNDSTSLYCYQGKEVTVCGEKDEGDIKDKVFANIYGNSEQNGTPSPSNPVEIESVGDKINNLVSKPYVIASNYTTHGVTFTLNDNGSITVSGTATDDSDIYYEVKRFYNLDVGKTYTISGAPKECLTVKCELYLDDGKTRITNAADDGDGSSFVLTELSTASNAKDYYRLYIKILRSSVIDNLTFYPHLEEGTTEPFYGNYGYRLPITLSNGSATNNVTLYLNEPLRKIGDTADYLDLNTGTVVRNIKQIMLTGSEDWKKHTSKLWFYYLDGVSDLKNESAAKADKTLSNYFKASEDAWSTNISGRIITNGTRVILTWDKDNTLDKFKSFLKEKYDAGNPVKIDYILGQSIKENIDISKLPKLEGIVSCKVNTKIQPSS